METYELFSLPSDHWTWIAVRELPWPHTGHGYVGCCGRCGSLSYTPRATYEGAWDDCLAHHEETQRAFSLLEAPDGLQPHQGAGSDRSRQE